MARRTKHRTNPKLAVAYVRVSTDDQQLGPEAQLAAIRRWAAAQGIEVVSVHRDLGVSGGAEIADRPALLEALTALDTHGAGVLLVAKRDRLARDVMIATTLERLVQAKGSRIISADGASGDQGDAGASMLMRGMFDLLAAYERTVIRSRTAAALAVKKSRGERVGAPPIGFGVREDGKLLVADEIEQAALGRIRELRAEGLSTRAIAEQLNAEGVPARGKRWHRTTIVRLLERATAEAA